MTDHSYHRFVLVLFGVFVLVWIAFALNPWYREDWLLENVLVIVAVPVLVIGYRRFPLSRVSYSYIFIFLCLHEWLPEKRGEHM